MKTLNQALLALIAATPVFAGVSEPTPAPASTYSSDLYHWFIGGGVEYLFDSEEDYWNAHFGYNFDDANALFVEVGWVGREDDIGRGSTADVDIVPITLNYKYEYPLSDRLSWYIGAGLGAANVDLELPAGRSDDDWSFMAQAFTGLVYEFTPSFEVYAGIRYMWIDDATILGRDVDDLDDWGIGAGLRFNF